MNADPLELLRAAYQAHATAPFGITAHTGLHGATVFRWRNYLTGASGRLGSAAPPDVIRLASALLGEMARLRRPRRVARKKPPQKQTRKPLLKKRRASA